MKDFIFHQLFERESCTYTYLLADAQTREAVIIDPVLETSARDLKLIQELDLKLKMILETHVHADHITGAAKLAEATSAPIGVSAETKIAGTKELKDGEILRFGKFTLQALATPGHTDSCMSFLLEDRVFTGDALLIRANGRTDFQQGSSEKLYKNVMTKLFTLPDETLVFPAHDYQGLTHSTIGTEKRHNPRLGQGRSLEEFVKIMANLDLALPKKIDVAVPANMNCGRNSN